MEKLQIEYIPIPEIVDYTNNPKKHPKSQIDKIKASIKEFGFVNPILLNKENVIIAGHGRLQAVKELGFNEIPVIWLEHLSEAQQKAFRIADNKLTESEWDEELLKLEFEGLEELEFNTDLTGFDNSEVSQIYDQFNETKEDNFDTDKALKEPKYKIEKGEIWQLGEHRLMCGDATSKEDVDKLMNGNKADMVFTDPPYGVNYSSKNEFLNKIDKGNRNQTPIENDYIEDYNKFFKGFLENLPLKENNSIYITISDQKLLELLESARETDTKMSQILVWVKNNHILGRQDYSNKHELIFYGWKGKHKYYGNFDTTVWEINRPSSSKEHPTMKPLKLMERAILNSSQKEQIVYDPFGGSGSTLIACEQTNRKCYMMEIDPNYCSVILERWEKYTNKKAQKIN